MGTDPQPHQSQDPIPPGREDGAPSRELAAHFSKSHFCRTIYADGAWGSVTGQANIHMALYSEHLRFPRSITYSLDAQGQAVEMARDVPPGLEREIEVEVIMSRDIAVALRDWLNTKIEEAQKAQAVLGMLGQERAVSE